jgi:hypothetical protein
MRGNFFFKEQQMGFFKKPVAQVDNDEQIRREIRARVAKQAGIYDEEYINTGKIGGTKNTDTAVIDTANPPIEAEGLTVETFVEAVVAPESDIVAPVVSETEVVGAAVKESNEINIEPKEKTSTKKNDKTTGAKPIKEKTPQQKQESPKEEKPETQQKPPKEEKPETQQKPPKEEKPQTQQKPPKEEKPQTQQKPPKEAKPQTQQKPSKAETNQNQKNLANEKISPKQKKPRKRKKTNIALILFIIILILAFIPLYYFLTGGNVEGPRLKVNSSDMTLFLNEPLLVRGMVSDSDNPDGMKVYYALDNGSASLLYTFKEGPGPFEYEIELPKTLDYLGEHSVTLYAENPTGELSKAIVLNYDVVKPGLTGLEIKTSPTKVSYLEGEPLDLTGLAVSASYEDGNTALISDYTSDVPVGTKLWKIGDKAITISYIEEEITKTVTFQVFVQKGSFEMPPKKMHGIYTVPAMNI